MDQIIWSMNFPRLKWSSKPWTPRVPVENLSTFEPSIFCLSRGLKYKKIPEQSMKVIINDMIQIIESVES